MQIIEQMIFHGHILNVYNTIDDPLFVAVEVARMIDYSNGDTHHMLNLVDDLEKELHVITVIRGSHSKNKARKTQKVWFLTEFGLYEVLMQSRKPIAQRFKIFVKSALREMRLTKNDSPLSWFNHIEMMADYQGYCDLLEDLGREPVTLEEYLNKE